MDRPPRWAAAFAFALAVLTAAGLARAQTITTAYANEFPARLENGVAAPTRPANLTPNGVNYADCLADMTLQFNLILDGFSGMQNMQIWATAGPDCLLPTSRGLGMAPTCWQLPNGLTQQPIGIPTSMTFDVRVQDLVGPQNAPPDPPVIVNEGVEACQAQRTFANVPITVWFLPLDTTGVVSGGAFSETIGTDLVGPPPPVGVAETVGDTLFNVTWMPNTDSETTGYDVFMDPPPGSVTDSGTATDATFTPTPVLYCPDAGTAAPAGDDASDDAGDATMSAAAPAADAGCFYITVGGGTPSAMLSNTGSCASTNLSGGFSVDSGVMEDDAGVVSASGGISTVPCSYVIGVGSGCYSGAGETVTGESTTGYTITGLTNGRTYDVVVASVDGYGNVGPPSSCVHDFPAPVTDFFSAYGKDGGKAGGGFCALEAVGLAGGSPAVFGGLAAAALALARRRRNLHATAARAWARGPRRTERGSAHQSLSRKNKPQCKAAMSGHDRGPNCARRAMR
jgi:hypothetical protein